VVDGLARRPVVVRAQAYGVAAAGGEAAGRGGGEHANGIEKLA